MKNNSKFEPTRHAAQRLQERFFHDISEEQAIELLKKLAKTAKPLKRVSA